MRKRLCSVMILTAFAIPLMAQEPPPPEDPIAVYFYPPELIMNHQRDLGLSQEQRDVIRAAIREAQSGFVDLEWQLSDETGVMRELVRQRPADEAKILRQVDKVVDLERQIKRVHLRLLIRIRNALTSDQLARLEEIRQREWQGAERR